MTSRRRLRGTASLKRRTTPRKPEPIKPEDYASAEKPIGMCRACGHHTSAFCGRCTMLVWPEGGMPTYCDCNCSAYLNGGTTA